MLLIFFWVSTLKNSNVKRGMEAKRCEVGQMKKIKNIHKKFDDSLFMK